MQFSRLSQAQHRLSEAALYELKQVFEGILPLSELVRGEGVRFRSRVFTPAVTFWAFLSQALNPRSSCAGVLQKVQALRVLLGERSISSNTSAYCQARDRLPQKLLQSVFCHVVQQTQGQVRPSHLWLQRRVRVVDCTGVSLPDTVANQSRFPQPGCQKPGCGFPVIKIGALFCLATGSLLHYALSPLRVYDGRLLRKLWHVLEAEDVLLGDRAFCSYATIAHLLRRRIDVVFRVHQRRPADLRQGKRIGPKDRLITWSRPRQAHFPMTPRELAALPPHLQLRQLKVVVTIRGFRTRGYWLITTLLDPLQYPSTQLAELFRRRWMAELCFRDLKTTMGMETLHSRCPTMAAKELAMFFIAYNLIRCQIFQAALKNHLPPTQISFKTTLTLIDYVGCLSHTRHSRSKFTSHLHNLIASALLRPRPNRAEPRALKRRPKPYQLLSTRRHLMRTIPHRSKYLKLSPLS